MVRKLNKIKYWLINNILSKPLFIHGIVDEVEILKDKQIIRYKIKEYKPRKRVEYINSVVLLSKKGNIVFESEKFPVIILNENDTLNITMNLSWVGGKKDGKKLRWCGDISLYAK